MILGYINSRALYSMALLLTVSGVGYRYPTLCIAIEFADHSHALSYFLGLLENLDYPKDRTILLIYLQPHIVDATHSKVARWADAVRKYYRHVSVVNDASNWREEALVQARSKNAKNVLLMTGDHFLVDHRIIQKLIGKDRLAIAPLLHQPFSSNSSVFVSEEYGKRTVIATVQMSTVPDPLLINLAHRDASYLTFSAGNLPFFPETDSREPLDVLANSALRMDQQFHVDNEFFYGYYFDRLLSVDYKRKLMRYLIADWVSNSGIMPIVHSSVLNPTYPKSTMYGADKIYVINLERRTERRQKMSEVMKLMGFDYVLWKATDGKDLESEPLYKEVTLLSSYEDPYHKRPMKAGEIGCFLSHYRIWQDVVQYSLKRVIVFEDDLRFIVNSTTMMHEMLSDIDKSGMEWDLIYLGRKRLENSDEQWVPGHRHLSTVGYSYWTLGYLLSLSGARKLLRAEPLSKLVPVDEYLPIMFDAHPNSTWKNAFPIRDLIAYSVYPTLVLPERYSNEYGYVSDTEDSPVSAIAGSLLKDEL